MSDFLSQTKEMPFRLLTMLDLMLVTSNSSVLMPILTPLKLTNKSGLHSSKLMDQLLRVLLKQLPKKKLNLPKDKPDLDNSLKIEPEELNSSPVLKEKSLKSELLSTMPRLSSRRPSTQPDKNSSKSKPA